MTEDAIAEMMSKPESGFDAMDPANVSPFVVWLGSRRLRRDRPDVRDRRRRGQRDDGWQHGTSVDKGRPLRARRGRARCVRRPDRARPRRPRPSTGPDRSSDTRVRTRTNVSSAMTEPALASDGRVIGARAQHTPSPPARRHRQAARGARRARSSRSSTSPVRSARRRRPSTSTSPTSTRRSSSSPTRRPSTSARSSTT